MLIPGEPAFTASESLLSPGGTPLNEIAPAMSNPDDRAPASQAQGSRPADGPAGSPSARDPMWTVRELMQWTQDRFAKAGIEGARTDVEYLLSAAMGCDRMSLYVRHDEVVSPAAKAVPERSRIEGGREEGCLPPSPAVTQVLLNLITYSPKTLP